MQKFEHNLTANTSGALRPLSGAFVTVTDNANGLPAALYSDNGVTPLPQPLVTDNSGYFGFYAADGKYTLTFSGSRFAPFSRQIVLEDPDDNPYASLAELASGAGAAGIGYGSKRLDKVLDVLSTTVASVRNNTAARSGERPMIIAHRGFDSSYPQNTLLAFSNALRAGADGIELDVSFSSDGVAYCFHDETVDALTTGTGAFIALPSATISMLKFKALAGSRFADEPVAKFADVLAWARKTGVPVQAELKQVSNSDQVAQFIQMIVDAKMVGLVSVQSGYFPNVETFRALNTHINVGFITADPVFQPYVDQLAALGNATVLCNHDVVYANPAMVAYCASKGVDLAVYTIPDTFYLNRVAAIGVTKFVCSRNARGNR